MTPYREPDAATTRHRKVWAVYWIDRVTAEHRRTEWPTYEEAKRHAEQCYGYVVEVDRLV